MLDKFCVMGSKKDSCLLLMQKHFWQFFLVSIVLWVYVYYLHMLLHNAH